jgi:hypothetical protein
MDNPIDGVFKTLVFISSGKKPDRSEAMNYYVNGCTIDTVIAFDTGKWETGIKHDGGSWVIVEQYENKALADIGHTKWVKLMTDNPNTPLKDINLWNI